MNLLQTFHDFQVLLVFLNVFRNVSWEIIEKGFGRTFDCVASPYFSKFILADNWICGPFQCLNDLLLTPSEPKVREGDESLNVAEFFEADSTFYEVDDFGDDDNHKFVDFKGILLLWCLIMYATKVLQAHYLFVKDLVQYFPNVFVS